MMSETGQQSTRVKTNDAHMHALTVDVEDWPQSTLDFSLPVTERAVANTRLLLSLLRKYRVRATFFVLGWLAQQFPEVVEDIAADGHEIGSHGYSHRPVFSIGPKAFADELKQSVRLLEEISGQKVLGYRAPDFSITAQSLWALDLIAEQGLIYDSSIFPVQLARYGIRDFPRRLSRLPNGLYELPLSTVRTIRWTWPVAGGGYFRLYPYRLTKWTIQQIQLEGAPAVVYLHPYELDPRELDEIEWDVPSRLRLTQGLNRWYTRAKLERMLQDFRFGAAADVIKNNEDLMKDQFTRNFQKVP